MFHIKIQAMFILAAALCAVPAYAKPAKTAKAAAPAAVATPVEVPTQPAGPERPANRLICIHYACQLFTFSCRCQSVSGARPW